MVRKRWLTTLCAISIVMAGCGAAEPDNSGSSGATLAEPDSARATSDPVASASPTTASQFAIDVVESTEAMFYADRAELAVAFDTIFEPTRASDLTEQMVAQLAPVRAALAEAPTAKGTWFVVRSLSTEVSAYQSAGDTTTATVEVWAMQLFSRQDVSDPETTFETNVFDLEDSGDGWRVVAWTIQPGPSARLSNTQFPSSASDLDRLLDGHRLPHEEE